MTLIIDATKVIVWIVFVGSIGAACAILGFSAARANWSAVAVPSLTTSSTAILVCIALVYASCLLACLITISDRVRARESSFDPQI